MVRESGYNHFLPWRDGQVLAYSALSGAVAVMTADNFASFRALLPPGGRVDPAAVTEPERELLNQLGYGRFLCPDDFDERRALRFRREMARFDQTSLGLVIAPTLACNMACVYCYEKPTSSHMPPAVMDALAALVEERAPALRALEVNWYGGEPLLAVATITALTERFVAAANRHGFHYGASIITNGVLLDAPMVKRLVALQVSSAQVTLDGPARLHDRQRPLRNGRSSFRTILQNVTSAIQQMAVAIRVNVDRSHTREDVAELLSELEQAGLRGRVGLYFGRLEPATAVCANIAESCHAVVDFADVEAQFYELLLERGFPIAKLPQPTNVFCMAQLANSFVVDPQGQLYRCWNHVGDPQRSMGSIEAPLDYDHANFHRLFEVDPFADEQCRACNLLPLCMGGCPSRRADRAVEHGEYCETWRYNLRPMLETIAASRQQAATHTHAEGAR